MLTEKKSISTNYFTMETFVGTCTFFTFVESKRDKEKYVFDFS